MITRRTFLATTGAAAVLTSCGRGSSARRRLELTVQFPYPRIYSRIIAAVASAFEERHPDIAIKALAPASDYEDLARRCVRSMGAGRVPDIAFHGMQWLRFLMRHGLIPEPGPDFVSWRQSRGYADPILDLARVDDTVMALPFGLSLPVNYVNTRLLGERFDPYPRNFDGWREMTARSSRLPFGQGLYLDYASENNWAFQTLLTSQGGHIASPDGSGPGFDAIAGLRALGVMAEIGKAGMRDMPVDQAFQAFNAGKLAILSQSSSRLKQLAADARVDFTVAMLPLDPGVGRYTVGGSAVVVHAGGGERRVAAEAFARFLGGPDAALAIIRHSGFVPAAAYARDSLSWRQAYERSNPHIPRILQGIIEGTRFFGWSGPNALKIPSVIRDELQAVIMGRTAPQTALASLHAGVSRLAVGETAIP